MKYRYAIREETKFVIYECCDKSKREKEIASFGNIHRASQFQRECQQNDQKANQAPKIQ